MQLIFRSFPHAPATAPPEKSDGDGVHAPECVTRWAPRPSDQRRIPMPDLAPQLWAAILAVTLLGGFVKGTVGFAMPMVMISGIGSFFPPETALAALILPTLATNVLQSLRNGLGAAVASARLHWRYIAIVMVMIALSAQLVNLFSDRAMFLFIGIPVVAFACLQLSGLRFSIPPSRRIPAEIAIGSFAGFTGGISGVWGPPTVIYLTALETMKVEQLRVQGIVYGLGAVVLTFAHLRSGVLNAETAPLSAALLVPAVIGIAIGFRVADRLDQARFRKATLLVLVIAGLNLVRRGLMM